MMKQTNKNLERRQQQEGRKEYGQIFCRQEVDEGQLTGLAEKRKLNSMCLYKDIMMKQKIQPSEPKIYLRMLHSVP